MVTAIKMKVIVMHIYLMLTIERHKEQRNIGKVASSCQDISDKEG